MMTPERLAEIKELVQRGLNTVAYAGDGPVMQTYYLSPLVEAVAEIERLRGPEADKLGPTK